MAAYLNRTHSVLGDGSGYAGSASALKSLGDTRVTQDTSPLQIFVKAKKKINDIFVEIEDYVLDTVTYIRKLQQDKCLDCIDRGSELENYASKVKGIREVLKRDHMKVAFFGRTSNGKSSVINAMLREKILPSGIGHTTNCFLQVEGSENGESYLYTEGSDERKNVQSVRQLAHALCKEKLSESQLVRIFWPRDKCQLLRDDVVFVDSPGIDVSPDLDEWIDSHCLDADVFVLVANAESTLMLAEKNFFHKVSTRLSKPNIFILNNRWDASASEIEYLDEVRSQHMERSVDFLTKELKVCSNKKASERIFFVSAKEVLERRLKEQSGLPFDARSLAEGFQNRYFEFQDFERKFEECISKSAVKTKFEQHSQRGKLIASEIHRVMDEIYENSLKLKSEKAHTKKDIFDKLNYTEQQLLLITQEMKNKIHHMVEDVEQKVSKALSEEIRRLAILVDEFNLPFHTDTLVLNVYKKELHNHVENGLGSNLRARLSNALAMNIQSSQKEMTDKMTALLPPDKKHLYANILPRREPFEIMYRLNCDNLCSDFQEDLEFRFSLGITALIARFSSKQSPKNSLANYNSQIPRSISLDQPDYSSPFSIMSSGMSDQVPWWSPLLRYCMGAGGTAGGGLLIAGYVIKVVGFRAIIITGAIFGSLYLYERLTWTNKAKERSFKQQYVSHVTKKLRLIVDLTSANCSHQVQQELSSTFARLCHVVDEATNDMYNEVKTLDAALKQLEEASGSAKMLRNKANYLIKQLEIFEEAYLKSDD